MTIETRRRSGAAVLVALALASMCPASAAQDKPGFEWSFKSDAAAEAPGAQSEEPEGGKGSGEGRGFDWSWSEPSPPAPAAPAARAAPRPEPEPATPPPVSPPRTARSVIDSAAYNDLLKENLVLRQQMEQVRAQRRREEERRQALQGELAQLEQQMSEMAGRVKVLKNERDQLKGGSTEVAALREQLESTETEKQKLARQAESLRRELARLQEAKPKAPPHAGVRPGSDLFRKIERENVELKQKLARLEEERLRAQRARGQAREEAASAVQEKADLEAALAAEKQRARSVAGLMEKMPDLERELGALRAALEDKSAALEAKDRDMETLSQELRRREYRLEKAERMAELLEETREEVTRVSDREKLNMHYNMGVVYTKEGRFEAAEAEYLKALQIDPADPDVHYNLAILYDDELGRKRKAALHYRRYLRARPHAPDAEVVRGWVMQIEMSQRR